MSPAADVRDIDPEVLKRLGIKRPRTRQFTKEDVRSNALRVLAVVANLTQEQRTRVLRHALNVNAI